MNPARFPSESFYIFVTNARRAPAYAHVTEAARTRRPFSLQQNWEGHGPQAVPYFQIEIPGSNLGTESPAYPADAGAGSSTLASRKNFAASSGGVGLM